MSVTVVAPLYGTSHDEFLPRWLEAVAAAKPDAVIVATRQRFSPCTWRYPTAFYLDAGIRAAKTDWVWVLGIDDLALPDALDGLGDVRADVWQMGFVDGLEGQGYIPPQLTAEEYLSAYENPFTACSAIRRKTYLRVGGFPDARLEDWALWRRMAMAGATFESSGRAHFSYTIHTQSRSKTELNASKREEHMAEVLAA